MKKRKPEQAALRGHYVEMLAVRLTVGKVASFWNVITIKFSYKPFYASNAHNQCCFSSAAWRPVAKWCPLRRLADNKRDVCVWQPLMASRSLIGWNLIDRRYKNRKGWSWNFNIAADNVEGDYSVTIGLLVRGIIVILIVFVCRWVWQKK